MKQLILSFAIICNISSAVCADFIDTYWKVKKFTGEEWYIDTTEMIDRGQSFYKGFAEGVFYNCNYEGQSATYTTYTINEFFANPEFKLFVPLADEISQGATSIFVHRITCAGTTNPESRDLIYPLVTNDLRKFAWYLFEGGVYTMENDN